MNLYHSWIYVHVLNTLWMVWTIVAFTFAANIASPVILWFILRGKKVIGKGGVVNGFVSSIGKKRNKGGA